MILFPGICPRGSQCPCMADRASRCGTWRRIHRDCHETLLILYLQIQTTHALGIPSSNSTSFSRPTNSRGKLDRNMNTPIWAEGCLDKFWPNAPAWTRSEERRVGKERTS